jgi:outer membrane protein assembly factor BamB
MNMSMQKRALALTLTTILTSNLVKAQQWVNPNYDAHRLDYRDLGYPKQNLLPADNSRITALLAHSNGLIYGATSGRTQSYLFLYSRYINKVRPLGKIAGAKGIYHCLLEGDEGKLYIGTGMNILAPVKLTKDFPVEYEGIEKQLWKDICAPYQSFEGGHIYEYDPETGDVKRYTNENPCPLKDFGVPIEGHTIYAMTFNPGKTKIYGVTYPYAHFFVFDITSKQTRDLGEFLTKKVYHGPERHWRTVPRALYCDPSSGCVYTSGDNGWLLRYDPKTEKIEMTDMHLPGEYWESYKSWDYPVVECFETDTTGNVYAGTDDGHLVRLDFENEQVVVLGKPRIMRRMRAMKVGKDGNLYMITGEFERICKLHTYDPSGQNGFTGLGVFAVDRSPYYSKRAYQFDAMAIGADGAVFCGESDRRGKLFIYTPGPVFKGQTNPTNPVVERMRLDTPGLIPEGL